MRNYFQCTIQFVFNQLPKQFETGKITKDELFGKVMEVLNIFSEGNADGKENYLYIIQSLPNLYDIEKKNAVLNKMRKKLGESQKSTGESVVFSILKNKV